MNISVIDKRELREYKLNLSVLQKSAQLLCIDIDYWKKSELNVLVGDKKAGMVEDFA